MSPVSDNVSFYVKTRGSVKRPRNQIQMTQNQQFTLPEFEPYNLRWMNFQIVSIVLAAGRSRRMGSPKPLLQFGTKTFLERILEAHRVAGLPTVVVLGPNAEAIRAQIDLSNPSLTCLTNPEPERGQLSSLQLALEQVAQSSALIVHPVDHPLVRPQTLSALARFHRRVSHCIVIPIFQGTKGHPVLFPTRFYPDLRTADPAYGAREVVHRNAPSVSFLPVDDPGISWDVDTPEQFQELKLKCNFK